MKKIDVILALITGEVVAWLFVNILKDIELRSTLKFLYWALPIFFPVLAVIGLGICDLIGKRFAIIFQAGKFFLWGSFITAVDLGVLNFLIWIFGIASGSQYSIFKGMSFLIATLTKYFGSKFWVFEKIGKEGIGVEVGKFSVVTLIGLGINVGIASFIVNTVGPQFSLTEKIWANIGGIAAAFFTFIWNFFGYKFIVFKK